MKLEKVSMLRNLVALESMNQDRCEVFSFKLWDKDTNPNIAEIFLGLIYHREEHA